MTDETTLAGDESEVLNTHNPRNDDIESIASRTQPPEELDDEEQDSETADTESSESSEQQTSEQVEEQEELLTLKVDGEEIKRSKKDVLEAGIKALQKESAADKRLREATELLNQVKQQNTRPPSDVAPQNQQPSIDAELIQKIQYGDETEAREALENLLGRNKLDPATIQQLVQQQVNEQITVAQIQQRFQSEFSDILADPYLTKLAADKAGERLQAGEPNNWDTYKAAAEEVKAWKSKFSAPVAPADTFADKKARKQSMTVINEASAKKALPEEDPPESVADVINDIRRARKQAV